MQKAKTYVLGEEVEPTRIFLVAGGTGIPVHPVAEMFPMMEGQEFEDFCADIKRNGLNDPLVINRITGELLDGRNRAKACEREGVSTRIQFYDGDDPVGFIVSQNIRRRHLTSSQRAMLAAEIEALPRGGGSPHHPKINSNPSPDGLVTEGDDGLLTREELAQRFDIGEKTLDRARRVKREGTPEEVAAVKAGQVTVSRAEADIRQRAKAEGFKDVREKGVTARSAKKEMETKLAKQKRAIDGIAQELSHIVGLFDEIEIESEHDPEDIERWIESYSDHRAKMSKFINRLKGAKE